MIFFGEALKLPLGGYEDFIRARTHDNKELETELRALLNGHGKTRFLTQDSEPSSAK